MKKRFLILATLILTLVTLFCVAAFTVSAEEAEPSVEIAKFNLAFENNTYLKYAVKFDGVDDSAITADNIGMLYWRDGDGKYIPGTEDSSSKTVGYQIIKSVKYYVFEYTHLSAKEMTDYVYSVAYLTYNGNTYYSDVVKYSVLDYAYEKLGRTGQESENEDFRILLEGMLDYGARAQRYFDYRTDSLAIDHFSKIEVVNGKFEDGTNHGLYRENERVRLVAEKYRNGFEFCHWENRFGDIVSFDKSFVVEVWVENEIYTAVYGDTSVNGLKYISNGDGTCYIGGIGTCKESNLVIPSVSPEGDVVTAIGNSAINSDFITSVTLPDTIVEIRKNAFEKCHSLVSITIPESIETIEFEAFYDCKNILKIINNSSFVFEFGSEDHGGIAREAKIIVDKDGNKICREEGWWCRYFETDDGFLFIIRDEEYTLIAYTGNEETVILPTSINGKNYRIECMRGVIDVVIPNGFIEIGNEAFADCKSLRSVTIPSSVTVLGEKAFAWCESLKTVTLNHGLQTIEREAFVDCHSLESITIPNSVTYIGESAFVWCSSLSHVTIPYGVEIIEREAFAGCSSLSQITLPYGIKRIEDRTFRDCKALETINIPESVTHIGESAFAGCSSLSHVTIPYGVEIIERDAFAWCENLKSVIISDSVTKICWGAFWCCSRLSKLVLPYSLTEIENDAFGCCDKLNNIFYTGDVDEWKRIAINDGNDNVFHAEIHYNCVHYRENETFATCTSDGSYDDVVYCIECDKEIFRIEVDVPSHHERSATVIENEKSATCASGSSYDEVVYCIKCNAEINRLTYFEKDALDHIDSEIFTENKIPATCTSDGSYDEVVYCILCGEEIWRNEIVIKALEHEESEVFIENEVSATCTSDGSYDEVVYCILCGEEIWRKTIVIEAKHKASDAVIENEIPVTCVFDGSYDIVSYCSVCNLEIDREHITIPMHAHILNGEEYNGGVLDMSMKGVIPIHSADSAEVFCDGYEHACCFFCEICHQAVLARGIARHGYSNIREDTATCTEDGVTYWACRFCYEDVARETEFSPAKGHDFSFCSVKSDEKGSYELFLECSRCKSYSIERTENCTQEIVEQPTCEKTGLVKFTFTNSDGETETVYSKIGTTPHTLNGVYVEDSILEYGTPNTYALYYQIGEEECDGLYFCEECNHSIGIKLIRSN